MPRQRVAKALIPAAGRGTRFLPVTKAVPKELLPIVSTPTLEFVLEEASRNGLTDVILVVNDDKQAISDYFAPRPDLEAVLATKPDPDTLAAIRRAADLARIHEVKQLEPRGLGHAVACGEELAAGEPLAVLLPDDLIDDRDHLLEQMLSVYDRHGGIVLGLIDVPRPEIRKYGSIAPGTVDGDIVEIIDLVEKPQPDKAPSTLAVIGRYVLPPEIFPALRDTQPGHGGEIQITDAMRQLVRDGVPAHGVVFRGRRYDTGDRLEYLKAVVQLAARHPQVGAPFTAWLREYVRDVE